MSDEKEPNSLDKSEGENLPRVTPLVTPLRYPINTGNKPSNENQ